MKARTWVAVGGVIGAAIIIWVLCDRGGTTRPLIADSGPAEQTRPQRGTSRAGPAPTSRVHIESLPRSEEAIEGRYGMLRVLVINAEERPVVGAVVASCDPEAAHASVPSTGFATAVTRADGTARVRLDVPLDVAHLIVLAKGYLPALVRVENRDQQRVKLDGEALLRGRVLINGTRSTASLTLSIYGYWYLMQAWSKPVHAFLGSHGYGYMEVPFDTDANGEFAVRGLIRGEQCVIKPPDGYVFVRPGEEIVTCDGNPVTLDLKEQNVLTGRIVRPNTAGANESALWIRYSLQSREAGHGIARGSVQADGDGAFLIRFNEPSLGSITLEIWEGTPARRIAVKTIEERIVGSKDLGDIALDDPTTVTFLVKDPAGGPIAGARVLAFGNVSAPTGADGRTALEIHPGTRAAVVGAPRFRIDGISLPARLPPMLEVRLEPACTVIARVRHEDPSDPLRGLMLSITREVDEVGAAADASLEFASVRIATPARSNWFWTNRSGPEGPHGHSGGAQSLWYDARPGADLVVSGFRKTDVLQLRVEDRYGTIIMNEEASFADGDTNAIELVVRDRARVIRGTVVGDRGEPLPGAAVGFHAFSLTGRDPHLAGRTGFPCDSSGRFELADVYEKDPTLLIAAPGHVERYVRGPEVFESSTFALDRARRLVVELTGPAIEGREGSAILEFADGATYERNKRSPDVFVFEDVPCRPATLRIRVRGSDTRVSVTAEDVRLQVARGE